jgi:hypothetical protein
MAKKKAVEEETIVDAVAEEMVDPIPEEPETSLDDLLGEINSLNFAEVDTSSPEGILSFQEQIAKLAALTKAVKKAAPKAKAAKAAKAPVELTEEQQEELAVLQSELVEAEGTFEDAKNRIVELKKDIRALTGITIASVDRGPRGIGKLAKNLILEGKTNEEIMAEIASVYPVNSTNVNCLNWYRNQLKHYPDTFGVKPKAAKVEKEVDMDDEGGDGEFDTVTVDSDAVHYATENEDGTPYMGE